MKDWQTRLARSTPFYYGWVVFGAVVGVGYSSRALMAVATLSVFVIPMTEEFGWSRGLFSGAVSVGGLVAVAVSPFAGRVIDRLGSGVVVAASSAVCGLGSFGMAFIGQPWAFYLLYVPARAAFAGPLELGTATALSNWFIRRRPFALTLLSVWEGTGLAAMPLVAQFIIGGWGWRASWGTLGLFGLVVGALPALLLIIRRPEDVGLTADPARASGPVAESPARPSTRSGRTEGDDTDFEPPVGGTRNVPPEPGGERNFTVAEALRTRAFWLLALFSAAGFMVQAGVTLHQVPHFIQQGMGAGAAALTAGAFAIAQTLGGIIWGFLAQRRAPLRFLLSLAGFTGAAGTVGIVASSSLGWGSLAALVLGIAVGGYHLLLRLAYAEYFGRASLGRIRGLTIGAQIGGQVVGPIVAGVLFDLTHSYWPPFLGFAAAVTAAGVAVTLAVPPDGPRDSAGNAGDAP